MYEQYRPSRFSLMPLVVKNLLIINGLFFLGTMVMRDTIQFDLTETLGLYFFKSEKFEAYQIVSHLFMHGSFFHIFSNMLALWMFGTAIENVWGSKKFLIYYLITGLGAAFLHTTVNYFEIHKLETAVSAYISQPGVNNFEYFVNNSVPDMFRPQFRQLLEAWSQYPGSKGYLDNSVSLAKELLQFKMDIPTVGASGAVFGVLLAFGMMFPNSLIYVYFAIPIRAKYFVAIYAALELWQGIANNPTDNVAHFAHLGGMLFGFILMKYWGVGRKYY